MQARKLIMAGCLLAAVARGEVDLRNLDLSVRPQDDFYRYATGGWLKSHPVPGDYGRWSSFDEVTERNKAALHAILERLAAAKPDRNLSEQQVGDFYASGMDEAAIEAAGLTPLRPPLARIAAAQTAAQVQAVIAHFHRFGIYPVFYFSSEQDPKDSTRMIAAAWQSGLGLPDRDYYLRPDEKSVRLREQYVAHVARIFELGGDAPAEARAGAQAVMRLETQLAQGSKTRVELRDPLANYHKLTPAARRELTPHFDWSLYAEGVGLSELGETDIGQPEFFRTFDRLLTEVPAADWRCYLRWHLLHSAAPDLGAAFVQENFEFYGRILNGTPQLRERWKRVLETADGCIGDPLGRVYVAECFSPEAKERMLALVGNLRAALRERLRTLEWMDEPTRQKALAKLDALGVKVGYPDKWIDTRTLTVDRGSYVANVLRAQAFNVQRELAKIGRPVDRTEWVMTAPTANAYYHSSLNEIVFPAGILQPPFFDAKADDAANYGAIGAVIGHEMTHGFDDQGRKFDAAGNLTDWWTPESERRFLERSTEIVRQFSAYVAIDDQHVNGELTQGENIADLGGLKIAYAALQKARAGRPGERIDGFTPEQRFFLSYANNWRANSQPENVRLRLHTDPHAPMNFRALGPLSNLDEFAAAFDIPEGAPMRRPKADRVEIW